MTRLLNAWGALGRDRRLAAMTSLGLFISMLLPWYSKTVVVRTRGGGAGSQSLTAFQAFSFVEAAVLLVSVGVLAMLFARAEQRDFHLPGGDGTIVMLAGAWVAILIFYRLFDKPGLQGNAQIVSSVGVQWGIFVALLVALGLAYVGRLMRFGERGAPPLTRPRRRGDDAGSRRTSERPGERTTVVAPGHGDQATEDRRDDARAVRSPPGRAMPARAPGGDVPPAPPYTAPEQPRPRRDRPRYPPGPSEQMSFEDAPPSED